MIDFEETIQRIRQTISLTLKKKKLLDKDVAIALNLDPQYYAVIKRRKKIPYSAIAHFCQTNKVNMTWILLNEKPQYLT